MEEAWEAAVHGIAKSQAQRSDFTFTFHFHALEKEMATHSCILAWRIPGREEPGGLPSMGSNRVGHATAAARVEREASGWFGWFIPSLIQSLGPGWGGGSWRAAVREVAKSWT